ncbi:MAG TPA: hypothetical protein VN157_01645 [Caulobacter sp.]|nr:hypothetical protein [Caulobacter sp.]
MTTELAILKLHASLARRDTPEAVAEMILAGLPQGLSGAWLRIPLKLRIQRSLKARFGWSAMAAVFKAVVPMDRQVAKAQELALLFLQAEITGPDAGDDIEAFLARFNRLIGRAAGQRNFVEERRNRAARAAMGLALSRRRYDKLFRLACRLEDRLAQVRKEEQKYRLLLIAKGGLASDLRIEDLVGRFHTAAFVAYFSARMKLRSEFTIQGQQKPFDDLAAAMLKACEADAGANWYAIAHVFPRADVLARLTDAQKGALLGRWFGVLKETADQLRDAFGRSQIALDTMIVKRGDDSSTWNLFAGAWNRARDHWIALVDALGMNALFEAMLPGKVLRLMAGDVAYWHRSQGGDVHPDTRVWRDLPKPWLVISGEVACGREQVERACAVHGVDPKSSGWSAPRPRTAVAAFKPTPELVQGVAVENPWLAHMMRRLGAYSGRPLREDLLKEILAP